MLSLAAVPIKRSELLVPEISDIKVRDLMSYATEAVG
jgi:hypothetical protein